MSVAVAVTLCLLVLLVLVLLSVHVKRLGGFPYAGFSLNWPHWANSVIESQCPSVCVSVCLSAPSDAVFFKASHWP